MPRRAIVALSGLLLAVLVCFGLLLVLRPTATAVVVAAPTPTPTPHASAAPVPLTATQTGPVAAAFVRAWGSPSLTDPQWHATMRRLATPRLAHGLDQTTRRITVAHVGTPGLAGSTPTTAVWVVQTGMRHGVSVALVRTGSRWLVTDIEPVQGDV